MGNPRPEEKKDAKPEEKKDYIGTVKRYLTSINKASIDDKAANPYEKRDYNFGVIQGQLSGVAAKTLDDVIVTGPLSEAKLQERMPDIKDPAPNPRLEAKWTDARTALLANAKSLLEDAKDGMIAQAKAEITKLFNPPAPPSPAPAPFDEQVWAEIFQTKTDAFKKDILRERRALLDEKDQIITGPPLPPASERADIEEQYKKQIAALDDLEKHFVKEVENQRDKAVFEAVSETKFSDPNAAGKNLVIGNHILNNGQELTLKQHAQRLLVTPKLDKISRILSPGIIRNTEELAEFETKGFTPGLYTTHIVVDSNGKEIEEGVARGPASYDASHTFEITDKGIKLYEGWRGWASENVAANADLMLEVFSGMSAGAEKGTLSIGKNVSLSAVEAFAKAVLERKEKGQDHPTLELDDKSIENLLKVHTKVLFGHNSPKKIAEAMVGLQGIPKTDPSTPEYQAAYDAALTRVTGIANNLQQEAKEAPKQQQAQHQGPTAKAMKS